MKCKSICFSFIAVASLLLGCSSNDDNITPGTGINLSTSQITGNSYEAFKDTIALESAFKWTVSSQENTDWVSFSPKKGQGDARVIITVENNRDTTARSTALTISTANREKQIQIKQPGITLQEKTAGTWQLKHIDFSGKALEGTTVFSGETKDDALTNEDQIILNNDGELNSSITGFPVIAHALKMDLNADITHFFEDGDWEIDDAGKTLTLQGEEYKIKEDSDLESELQLELNKLPEHVNIELTDQGAPELELSDIISGLEDVRGTMVLKKVH